MTDDAWQDFLGKIEEIRHFSHNYPETSNYKAFILDEMLSFHGAMGTILGSTEKDDHEFHIIFQTVLRRILENYFIVIWIWNAESEACKANRYERKVNDFKKNYYKVLVNLAGIENNNNTKEEQIKIKNICNKLKLDSIPSDSESWKDLQGSESIASIASIVQTCKDKNKNKNKKYAGLYMMYQMPSLFAHGNISKPIMKKAFQVDEPKYMPLKYNEVAKLIAKEYLTIFKKIKMTITINIDGIVKKAFEGPFNDVEDLKNESGVYVVLDEDNKIVDVGESQDVKNQLESHKRSNCWKTYARVRSFAAYYTDKTSRMVIEKAIREKYDPPCGER